ncbi:MAG: family N-acetyltransferase [Acidobacteria bacterium]|nr:family N-acetyltransferase [Acidobacteriota bacterium]
MSRVHGDWGAPGFALPPVADLSGPFPRRPFLETWWRHRGMGEALIAESPTALLPACLGSGGLEFMGEADLTDYHSPLGDGGESLVADLLAGLEKGTPFCFDSLPEEAAAVVAAGAARGGREMRCRRHGLAAVLDLPASYDEYLAGLDGKERHELRRKQRRFAAAHGAGRLVEAGRAGLGIFTALHRAARGPKGGFLTEEMEAFFADLLGLEGARLDLLVPEGGEPVAAAFGFGDGRAYYLYNSAYDPRAAATSPGVMLVDLLVRRCLAEGLARLDLLKGDEAYKFRLGARPRPLFMVEGRS